MQKIYNIIGDQRNEQIKYKAALGATFQAVKTGQDPIGYLINLKELFLSNQYE